MRSSKAKVHAIFEDAASGICFRGDVLGDQRAGAFDGAKLDVLRTDASNHFERFGRFDGRRFDWFKPVSPFHFGWVGEQSVVQARNGEWWVGGGAGLYRFPASDNFASIKTARPLAVYTTKDGLGFQQVWRVFADSGGNVWFSAFYGLARWDRSSQTLHDLANSPNLPTATARARSGSEWLAAYRASCPRRSKPRPRR